jgi:hypothetical protein
MRKIGGKKQRNTLRDLDVHIQHAKDRYINAKLSSGAPSQYTSISFFCVHVRTLYVYLE